MTLPQKQVPFPSRISWALKCRYIVDSLPLVRKHLVRQSDGRRFVRPSDDLSGPVERRASSVRSCLVRHPGFAWCPVRSYMNPHGGLGGEVYLSLFLL